MFFLFLFEVDGFFFVFTFDGVDFLEVDFALLPVLFVEGRLFEVVFCSVMAASIMMTTKLGNLSYRLNILFTVIEDYKSLFNLNRVSEKAGIYVRLPLELLQKTHENS